MKKILLYIVISFLVAGCKYFEEKRLFSKKVDTLINYAEGIAEPVDTGLSDTLAVSDLNVSESRS